MVYLIKEENMSEFKKLGIKADLIKGLKELNIVEPSKIQQQVIPILLNQDTDLVGQAQTGTGKTAAFGLPLLQKIDTSKDSIQALVLCPTRELGQQVAKQFFKFTKYTDKIFTTAVYGGEKIELQIERLRRVNHIIVATPGRLLDLIRRKDIDIRDVHTLVMDEADEMLSMGFKKDLDSILKVMSKVRNKWLFSATLPNEIKAMVNRHLSPEAFRIEVNKKQLVNKDIDHKFVICDELDKLNVLLQFLKSETKNRGVIFCKTKAATQKLAQQLQAKNISADAIHGDLKQKERDKVMRAFKNENLRMLVATDLAARGIDISGLSFVVHYQLPDQIEYYTHRSGRTARAGKKGIALAIVTSKDMKNLRYIEKNLAINFKQVR